MGGAESLCEVARIGDTHAQLNLQCQAGQLSTTAIAANTGQKIFQAGVIPQSATSFSFCSASAFIDPAECSSYLDLTALEAKINDECSGKKSCQIKDIQSFMPKAADAAASGTSETASGGSGDQAQVAA